MKNKVTIECDSMTINRLKEITYEQYVFYYKYWVEGMFNDKYKNYKFYGQIKNDSFKIVYVKYGSNCFNPIIEGIYNDNVIDISIKNNFRLKAGHIFLYIMLLLDFIMLICDPDVFVFTIFIGCITMLIMIKRINIYVSKSIQKRLINDLKLLNKYGELNG